MVLTALYAGRDADRWATTLRHLESLHYWGPSLFHKFLARRLQIMLNYLGCQLKAAVQQHDGLFLYL